jgi:hypothetical protein
MCKHFHSVPKKLLFTFRFRAGWLLAWAKIATGPTWAFDDLSVKGNSYLANCGNTFAGMG